MKAREGKCEQEALQTNSQLQQEISVLTSKVRDLEVELSSAQHQHTQHTKVSAHSTPQYQHIAHHSINTQHTKVSAHHGISTQYTRYQHSISIHTHQGGTSCTVLKTSVLQVLFLLLLLLLLLYFSAKSPRLT